MTGRDRVLECCFNVEHSNAWYLYLRLIFFPFSFFLDRLLELSSIVPINAHWGVISKCLAYSKAVSDPFVYSLLRHQYKKTWKDIINKMLKRGSINSSALRSESQSRNFLQGNEWRGKNCFLKCSIMLLDKSWGMVGWHLWDHLPTIFWKACLLSVQQFR